MSIREKILIALTVFFVASFSTGWSFCEYHLFTNTNMSPFLLILGLVGIIVVSIIFCKSYTKKN